MATDHGFCDPVAIQFSIRGHPVNIMRKLFWTLIGIVIALTVVILILALVAALRA